MCHIQMIKSLNISVPCNSFSFQNFSPCRTAFPISNKYTKLNTFFFFFGLNGTLMAHAHFVLTYAWHKQCTSYSIQFLLFATSSKWKILVGNSSEEAFICNYRPSFIFRSSFQYSSFLCWFHPYWWRKLWTPILGTASPVSQNPTIPKTVLLEKCRERCGERSFSSSISKTISPKSSHSEMGVYQH